MGVLGLKASINSMGFKVQGYQGVGQVRQFRGAFGGEGVLFSFAYVKGVWVCLGHKG